MPALIVFAAIASAPFGVSARSGIATRAPTNGAVGWERPDLPGAQFTDVHLAADSLAQTLLVPEHWA